MYIYTVKSGRVSVKVQIHGIGRRRWGEGGLVVERGPPTERKCIAHSDLKESA